MKSLILEEKFVSVLTRLAGKMKMACIQLMLQLEDQ